MGSLTTHPPPALTSERDRSALTTESSLNAWLHRRLQENQVGCFLSAVGIMLNPTTKKTFITTMIFILLSLTGSAIFTVIAFPRF